MAAPDPTPPPARPDGSNRAQTARLAVAALIAVLFAAFAIDNRQDVTVGWVFDDGEIPLFVALVASALVGLVVGWLLAWRRRHRRR